MQLWLCYCTLLHLPGLELWTLRGQTLPGRSVDRTGVVNAACRNGMLPMKCVVLKKITKRRGAQRVLEVLGLGSAWGEDLPQRGFFCTPYKGRPAMVIFPRCLWVVPEDVPSCRRARCCCISQSRWGILTWFMQSWTLTYSSLRDPLVTNWEQCSMGKGQCWGGELVQKDRAATELWFMIWIWRKHVISVVSTW